MPEIDRLHVKITGDSGDFERSTRKAEKSAGGFEKKLEGIFSKFGKKSVDVDVEAHGAAETSAELTGVDKVADKLDGRDVTIDVNADKKGISDLSGSFAGLAGNIKNTGTVLKASAIPFALAGVGGAIPTITAAAASTGGLALSLGRASAGFALVAGAAGGGVLVGLKAYTAGLSSTISASREAYEATNKQRMEQLELQRQQILSTKASENFNREIDRSSIILTKLQAAIGRGSFPIFTTELKAWNGEITRLTPKLAGTTTGISEIAAGFSKWFRTAEDGKILNRTVGFLADSALSGADMLQSLGVTGVMAFQPLIPLARGLQGQIQKVAASTSAWTQSAEGQSKLGEIYRSLWSDAKRLGGAVWNLGRGVVNVFDAIDRAGLDDQAFGGLEKISAGFAKITSKGTESRRTLNGFLTGAKELMPFVTGAVGAFASQFGRVANVLIRTRAEGSKLTVLQETFRGLTKAASPLGSLLISTFKGLGPEIPKLVVNLAKLAEIFAGSTGPLVFYVRVLNRAMGIFNRLPGPVKTAVANLLGLKLILGGMGFGALIGGLFKARTSLVTLSLATGGTVPKLRAMVPAFLGLGGAAKASSAGTAAAGAAAAASGKKLGLLGRLGRIAAGGFRFVGLALRFVLGPWGLLIAAVTVGAVLIYRNWDRITKAAQPLISAFRRAWGVAKNLAAVFGGALLGNFESAQKAFDKLPASVRPLAATLANVGLKVRDFARNALSWLQAKARQFVIAWRKHWPDIKQSAAAALSGTAAVIRRVGGQALSWLQDKARLLIRWWNTNLPLIKKTASTVFGALETIVGNAIRGAALVVRAVWGGLSRFWARHGERIVSISRSVWRIVSTTVENAIRIVGNVLRAGMQVITGDWRGAWKSVGRIGSLAWDTIETAAREGWKILGHLFQIGKEDLLDAGQNLWSGLTNVFKRGTSSITNTLRDWKGDADRVFSELRSNLKDTWDSLWGGLYDRWDKFRGNFSGGIRSMISDVKGFFRDGFSNLDDIMGDKFGKGVNTARYWLGGLMYSASRVLDAIGANDLAKKAKGVSEDLKEPLKMAKGGMVNADRGGVGDGKRILAITNEAGGPEAVVRLDKRTPQSDQAVRAIDRSPAYGGKREPGSPHTQSRVGRTRFMAQGGVFAGPAAAGVDLIGRKFGVTGTTYEGHGRYGSDSAADFVVQSGGAAATGANKDKGDAIASFAEANWDSLNLENIIWYDMAKWAKDQPWAPYDESQYWVQSGTSDTLRHMDHDHLQFAPSGVLGAITNAAGSLGSSFKDAGKWLRKKANQYMSSFASSIPSFPELGLGWIGEGIKNGLTGDLVGKASNFVFDQAQKFVTEKFGFGGDSGSGGASSGALPTGKIKDWIVSGFNLSGVAPPSEENQRKFYALGKTESDWIPTAVQKITDINSFGGGAGGFPDNLARGALQNTPKTWEWVRKMNGKDLGKANPNIFDPVKSVAARARNQMAMLGHISDQPGYLRGGVIPGPNGQEVMVQAHSGERVLSEETNRGFERLASSVEIWSARNSAGSPRGLRRATEISATSNVEGRLAAIEEKLDGGLDVRIVNGKAIVEVAAAYHGSTGGRKRQSENMAKEIQTVLGTRPESR